VGPLTAGRRTRRRAIAVAAIAVAAAICGYLLRDDRPEARDEGRLRSGRAHGASDSADVAASRAEAAATASGPTVGRADFVEPRGASELVRFEWSDGSPMAGLRLAKVETGPGAQPPAIAEKPFAWRAGTNDRGEVPRSVVDSIGFPLAVRVDDDAICVIGANRRVGGVVRCGTRLVDRRVVTDPLSLPDGFSAEFALCTGAGLTGVGNGGFVWDMADGSRLADAASVVVGPDFRDEFPLLRRRVRTAGGRDVVRAATFEKDVADGAVAAFEKATTFPWRLRSVRSNAGGDWAVAFESLPVADLVPEGVDLATAHFKLEESFEYAEEADGSTVEAPLRIEFDRRSGRPPRVAIQYGHATGVAAVRFTLAIHGRASPFVSDRLVAPIGTSPIPLRPR
jgi:hypothetical protein